MQPSPKSSGPRSSGTHIASTCKLSIYFTFLTSTFCINSKVAPQNIMYDRRVVRGNTFAALVIPVNMQPDPALIEKQRMEEAYMKQRQEEMRMRRQAQERQREREREEERDQNMQMQQMTRANNWEELSDREGFIPETEIQPDYYIDRPPDAVFIPNPAGQVKAT